MSIINVEDPLNPKLISYVDILEDAGSSVKVKVISGEKYALITLRTGTKQMALINLEDPYNPYIVSYL